MHFDENPAHQSAVKTYVQRDHKPLLRHNHGQVAE